MERKGDNLGSNSYLLNNKGDSCKKQGQWEEAANYYKDSLTISNKTRNIREALRSYIKLGDLYLAMGEWEESYKYYKKVQQINFKVSEFKEELSKSLSGVGNSLYKMGRLDKANERFVNNLEFSKKYNYIEGILDSYLNIGLIYQDKGNWNKALNIYKDCFEIATAHSTEDKIPEVLNRIGEVNIKIGNWDEARKLFDESLNMKTEIPPLLRAKILKNSAELFRLEKKYEEAIDVLNKTIKVLENKCEKAEEVDTLERIGYVYLTEGIDHGSSLRKAKNTYDYALRNYNDLDSPPLKAKLTRGLGIIESKNKKIDEAKKYFLSSLETSLKMGIYFEHTKTVYEYSRALYENNNLVEAEIAAKSIIFDTLETENKELLVNAYLLLGDINMKKSKEYNYFLDSLKHAEFDPNIYVRTCYFLIYRMQKMNKDLLSRFIKELRDANKDDYFDLFLEAVNNKVNCRENNDTLDKLPCVLLDELHKFNNF